VIKDIPFNYSGHDGAYLYCAQYCDNDVVIAGGSGTNSIQAVNKVTGEVSLLNGISFITFPVVQSHS
jgi:acetoacetate decarboxylase